MRNFKFDRLKFNWAGEWVSNFQYIKDDIVSFQGKSYVCLTGHTSTDFEFDNNEYLDDEVTFDVTVGIDSVGNQRQGKFYIDGEENPELQLLQQRTYIFDQADSTNVQFNESRNIFLISLGEDGSLSGNKDIDTGVTYLLDNTEVTKEEYINGFPTATDKSISIRITDNFPRSFYYYSIDNKNLGAKITAPYSSNWELMFDGKRWRADWTVSTEYYPGNIVKFRGYLYECLETHLSSSVATLGVTADPDKWKTYAATYNYRQDWQPQTNFSVGDVVRYNGINYLCVTSHFSASTEDDGLEADQINWIVFTRSDNWRQDWTTEVKYNVNDVVRYGGIVYRCIESHVSAENTSQGLEFNQASWEIVLSGVEYKQDWQSGFRYKLNDIVKYGSTLWICVLQHQSREELADDEDNWNIWLPGLEYEVEWDAETNYQVGDVVYYGGYIYAALNNNLNSVPSQVGLQQDFGDWELVTRSYNFKGNWDNLTQYRVGDVVRQSSYLYVARLDNESVYPDSSSAWELLIPGEVVVGEWTEDREYFEGDVVLRAGTAYLCVDRHSSATADSRPDIDIEKTEPEYWTIFILGDVNNVLVDRGDLKTFVPTGALQIDTAFDTGSGFITAGGETAEINDLAIQPDGKILAAGDFIGYDDTPQDNIFRNADNLIRINSDGSVDTTFFTGSGFTGFQFVNLETVALQQDGKILIGGRFISYDGTDQSQITRLNADGSRDTTFDIGTGITDGNLVVSSIALQQDGKILVGGRFGSYNDTPQNSITRLNADGSLDTTFDIGTGIEGGDELVSKILLQSDSKILVGGRFTSYNGTPQNSITRLNADGSLDTTFDSGTGFDNLVSSVVIQSDSKILVGGSFNTYNGTPQNSITRLNADGSLDTTFNSGTGFDNPVSSVVIQSDSKILVGGSFGSYNGTTQNNISRLDADGSLDTTFDVGTGFDSSVTTLVIQSNDKILVGGTFEEFNDTSVNSLVRLRNKGNVKLDIGLPGNVLKVSGNSPAWLNYGDIDNIFYVSTQGTDGDTFGTTQDAAFRTIKFATDFILADVDNRTPATIFIKTGLYEEQLPIRVPSDVALVGDELRSTTVRPAAGFEQSDMFYVRNGSGIRNMSLQGLKGTLGERNEFFTRRPTAGAYVSLDPGQGPDDESVWIKTKSCYVQNVSTQGEACIGMKIDGALHNGGNRSIVANDFTQVLSDGIGYWADNRGRSELVSVFTYFCHIGYLATNGGILRGTNGNNSYGEFGSVAEGFDEIETVKTASIDNRQNEAQFSDAFTFGTDKQEILAIGYSHAGQDYTSADITFGGTGSFAEGNFVEFRDNAISNVRIIAPEDSTPEGGLNYTNIVNNAQGGDNTKIKLATADSGDPAEYVSQRIVIESGLGVGQYAEIVNYDTESKEITVSRESDGGLGWDHFQPGWPIEPKLDETTRYRIEPRPIIDPPPFSTSSINAVPNGSGWEHIIYGSEWLAATGTADGSALFVSTSSDGSNWSAPESVADVPAVGITYASGKYFLLPQSGQDVYIGPTFAATDLTRDETWIDIASDSGDNILVISSMNIVVSTDSGQTFTDIGNTTVLDYSGRNFISAGYGNGKFIIIDDSGDVLYSQDLTNWDVSETVLSTDLLYSQIAYGNNRFIALATDSGIGTTRFARSFNGIDWYEETIETAFSFVSYGDGVFIATGDTAQVAKSQDGAIWRTFNDDSVQYTLPQLGVYRGSAYHDGTWIITESTGNSWGQVQTGAEPIIRVTLDNARIEDFEIYDPGSNYNTVPNLTVLDNIATIDVLYEVIVNDGVLPQPEMTNRGEGYVNASAEITGDGFAEIFQTGLSLVVDNLTEIPGPGANLDITGIDDRRYSVTRVNDITGAAGSFQATIDIFPGINLFESPEHGTSLSLRERYSQIRLTGHDFLDIGTGNEGSTRYPELYLEGETSENSRKPFNETVSNGGGRVFYTSTDQDGNFRVGELFTVDQSTGIVTISASQFDLGGLDELSLGGIQVGGTAVIIREFSKDPTFAANSDNIVPTEAAIKAFLESRISGGSANAQVNVLIAGQVEIGTNTMNTTSGFPILSKTKMNLLGGIDGTYLALQYFANAHNFESPEE